MKIAHIIPTYNEKDNIGLMIGTIFRIGRKYRSWQNYVIVVDDQSPDGTSSIVKKYQQKNKNIFLLLKKIGQGFDVVVASRHVAGSKVVGWNWFRKLNHDISNSLLAWLVAGVHEVKDHAGNFKAIRVKNCLEKVPLIK